MGIAWQKRKYVVLFEDEMTIQMNPTLCRMWGRKGIQPEIGAWVGGHQKTHVFGAINTKTGSFHSIQGKKINAKEFIKFLKRLRKSYPRKVIVIIMDNACWHKAKKVKFFMKKDGKMRTLYLPPYSPKLNPVEKLWKFFRRNVSHNYFFGTLTRLIQTVANYSRSLKAEKERLISFCQRLLRNNSFSE